MTFRSSRLLRWPDALGAVGSSLCLVHCGLLPLISLWAPALHVSHSQSVGLGWGLVVLSAWALLHAVRNSRSPWRVALIVSFAGLFASQVLETWTDGGHTLQTLSSLALILFHLLNYRYCRACHRPE